MPFDLNHLDYHKLIYQPELVPKIIEQIDHQSQLNTHILQTWLNLKMLQTVVNLRRLPIETLKLAYHINRKQLQATAGLYTMAARSHFQNIFQTRWLNYFNDLHQQLLTHTDSFITGVHQAIQKHQDLMILPPTLKRFLNDHCISLLDLAGRTNHQLKQLVDQLQPQTIHQADYHFQDDPVALIDNFRWIKQLQHHLWMKNWIYFRKISLQSIPNALITYCRPT